MLRENSRKLNSFVIFSRDEGRTWTKPIELPAALTGIGMFADMPRTADWWSVFVTWRMSHRSKAILSPGSGPMMTYATARKGSIESDWQTTSIAGTAHIRALEVLPDGTFVATTYGHWIVGEEPFIMSVRFKVEEFD